MQKHYYEILGVSVSDSKETIKKAYHKLARQFHPDLNPGDKAAEERFKEIGEAYEILCDPEQRAAYDHEVASSQSAGTASKPASAPFTQEMYHSMMGQFQDFFDVEGQAKAKKRVAANKNPLDAKNMFNSYFGSLGSDKKK